MRAKRVVRRKLRSVAATAMARCGGFIRCTERLLTVEPPAQLNLVGPESKKAVMPA